MREPPAIAPPVFCRATLVAVDEPLPGDKADTQMALVITAPVDVPLRVPLTNDEAISAFRAIGSMLNSPITFTSAAVS